MYENINKKFKKLALILLIALTLPIILLIVLPKNNIAVDPKISSQQKQIKNHDEVLNEIIEILKNNYKADYNAEDSLKNYLSNDFVYIAPDKYEHKSLSSFFSDIKIFNTSYEVERRGDTSQDKNITYRIYWDIVEQNKANGIQKQERGYCLQTINIYLKKVEKEDIITYQIEKIILNNP